MSKIAAIIGQWRHFFERAFIKRESPNFHPITLMMAPIMHTCNRWLKPAESLYFIIIKEPVEPFFPFPKHLIIQSAIHYQSCIGNELETKSLILSIFMYSTIEQITKIQLLKHWFLAWKFILMFQSSIHLTQFRHSKAHSPNYNIPKLTLRNSILWL